MCRVHKTVVFPRIIYLFICNTCTPYLLSILYFVGSLAGVINSSFLYLSIKKKINSLISATIHCVNLVDFYIQISFTNFWALSINLLYLHRVFSSMYGYIHIGPWRQRGTTIAVRKWKEKMCTQTKRVGSESREDGTWLELASPLALTQDGKQILSWIAVKHFSTNNGSSNRIAPQVRSSQSSLGSQTYRTAHVWRGGQLQGCYIHVHLNRVWHKANTDTARDNNGAMQVYPGLASSLRALYILPFASSSSRNSTAGKTGMPSTVCLLKYSSLLLTPHRAVQQAVLPHLPLQYQLLRSSTAMRIIKGV